MPQYDAERRFGIEDCVGPRQSGLRVRRHPARRQEADRLQAVRHGLHAGNADGLLHGLGGRRLRRALDLRPLPRSRTEGIMSSENLPPSSWTSRTAA